MFTFFTLLGKGIVMARIVTTTPSLRRAIERDRIISNYKEFVENPDMPVKEKENSYDTGESNKLNCHSGPLHTMVFHALQQACSTLGVQYW